MPKKLPRRWRGVFLRALRRTGNVRASAARAGVDPGTAYDHRIKDAGFAGKWAGALEAFQDKAAKEPLHRPGSGPGRSPSPAKAGEELVARRSKNHGVQLVRAAVGRWCARVEATFLAGLERTGCVRAAARACGFSTTALYNRRKRYPDLAERWAAAEAQAGERIPGLLSAATIASLDPELEEEGLPGVSIDQAIAICRLKGFGARPGGAKGGRFIPPEPSIEEVRANILRKLDAIEAAARDGAED